MVIPHARTVCMVEREASAVAALVARMQDGWLDDAPIWTDLATFDGKPWRGVVDCITAGFPCQPWSVAGQRRGTLDDRWIWPHIARIIGEVQPRWVFLENVPGLLRYGLSSVLADLAAQRFDAEWLVVSAAEVGAPHKRERVFIMADAGRLSTRRAADTGEAEGRQPHAELGGRGEHLFPPRPNDADGWRDWLAAGGPAPAESGVRGNADGLSSGMDISRPARLRALGNAVVPQQAVVAFRLLMQRFN